MKKIDFKINYSSPRYILPLVILPFLFGINWIVLDAFGAPGRNEYQAAHDTFDRLNTEIPEANLYREEVSTKFEAIKEAFKGRLGLSAINELDREQALPGVAGLPEGSKPNSPVAKDWMDSLAVLTEMVRRRADRLDEVTVGSSSENSAPNRYFKPYRSTSPFLSESPAPPTFPASKPLGKTIALQNPPGGRGRETGSVALNDSYDPYPGPQSQVEILKENKEGQAQEMRIWKAQMLLLDSLIKTPEERAAEQALQRKKQALKALALMEREEKERTLRVSKAEKESARNFNTIGKEKEDPFIKAIIDEDIKVVSGSRIRIRVLDDIDVGGYLLEKGSYVYARVSEFSDRRIHLTVRSILIAGRIRKVDLEIFGNDGIRGLYVPKSDFTAFTKELGSDLSTGGASEISLKENPGSLNQILFGVAETGIQATGKAAGKAARKNRALLKYNTILYLVNADNI